MKYNRFIISIIVVTINCSAPSLQAKDGQLMGLYHAFLQDANSQAFVAFERESVVPKMSTGDKEIKLDDGRAVKLSYHGDNKDYFSIIRNGSNYIIAFSKKVALTNSSNFALADELYGFDGDFYWTLSLNNPVKSGSETSNFVSTSSNPLTIIPVQESFRKQGKYQSDFKLAVIQNVNRECLNVIQFGCLQNLRAPPKITNSIMTFFGADGKEGTAKLIGNEAKPAENPFEIDYQEQPHRKIAVFFDYGTDTLTLTRSALGKLFFQARYRILAEQTPLNRQNERIFSWQSYKGIAGNVIAMLITNGATMKLEFTNGTTPQVGYVMDKARPPRSISARSKSKQRIYIIYTLFALVTAGAVVLMLNTKTKDIQKKI